jgi:hypothetical protein
MSGDSLKVVLGRVGVFLASGRSGQRDFGAEARQDYAYFLRNQSDWVVRELSAAVRQHSGQRLVVRRYHPRHERPILGGGSELHVVVFSPAFARTSALVDDMVTRLQKGDVDCDFYTPASGSLHVVTRVIV